MTSFFSKLFGQKPASRSARKAPRKERERRLRLEQMEKRQLLASDLFGAVEGTVFTDLTDNGTFEDGTDPGLAGATVRLYNDVNNNGTLEPGTDTQVGTDIQTDANGNYIFTNLAAGNYIVEQLPVAGQLQRSEASVQAVTVVDDTGIRSDPLDALQTVTDPDPLSAAANATETDQQAGAANEIVGNERDVVVTNSPASGSSLDFDISPLGLLVVDAGVGTSGAVEVTYDGVDASPTVNAHGLNLDLTANNGGAFVFEMGRANESELNASFLTVEVYSGNDNTASRLRLPIPFVLGGSAEAELHFCFDDFERLPGASADADFTDVSAVKLVMEVGLADDISVDFVGIEELNAVTADMPNLNPMSIGNQVFNDANNNGTLDGGESGIDGVQIELYEDTNDNGVYDDGIDQAVVGATGTTSGGGFYLFENLFPGNYIPLIPTGQAVLDGLQSSEGNPDPENNVNGDDNGVLIAGVGFASGAVSLVAGSEPTDDGDADTNTNLSVDFGFAPALDLSIGKTAPTTVIAGNTLTYTVTVNNTSDADATNAFVIDNLPAIAGLTNDDITVSRSLNTGTGNVEVVVDVTQANSEIRVDYDTFPANSTDTITIAIDLPASTPAGTLTNNAQTGADETETDPNNNDASVDTTVTRDASLSITKSDSPDPAARGGTLTYEIIVTNTGPSTSTNTILSDTLTTGLTFVPGSSSASNGSTVSATGQAVTSNLGTLEVGVPVTVTISTTVANDFPTDSIPNTASVDSTEADPAQATATTTLDPVIDLILSKVDNVADGSTIARGEQLQYTLIVTNDGPSDATNVRILDTLPTQLDFVEVNGGTASGPDANRLLTINVGDIASGQSSTVTITTTVQNDSLKTRSSTPLKSPRMKPRTATSQ